MDWLAMQNARQDAKEAQEARERRAQHREACKDVYRKQSPERLTRRLNYIKQRVTDVQSTFSFMALNGIDSTGNRKALDNLLDDWDDIEAVLIEKQQAQREQVESELDNTLTKLNNKLGGL